MDASGIQNNEKKILTLAIVCEPTRILLGLKKRGFGAGKWNSFGGKIDAGETIEEAAAREVYEEAGIAPGRLAKAGILEFSFQNYPESLEIHVFRVLSFSGEPAESEEMRPQWFPIGAIPYDKMWAADRYWLPLFLQGKKFRALFKQQDFDTITSQEIRELEEI